MTVTVYQSTDASAPTLATGAGSLITLLDAVLVNGYGAKAAAGWTKPFSGTNKAAYLQGTGGNSHYLRVDDTSGGTSARTVGYESMSDVDTGTNGFPTNAQVAGGNYLIRHDGTGNNRPWTVIADSKSFYLFIQPTASSGQVACFFFGKTISLAGSDAYSTAHIGADGVTSSATANANNYRFSMMSWVNVTIASHWMARNYAGAVGAVALGKHADFSRMGSGVAANLNTYNLTWFGNQGLSYPNPTDGALLLNPIFLHEASNERAYLPGAYCPLHNLAYSNFDTFTGSGAYAGKVFIVMNLNNGGVCCIDTTGPW
jgi:hypothetical protein